MTTATTITTEQDRAVLAKYLLEAHGKEQQLETALQAQIAVAQHPGLERPLTEHLAVTREQIASLELRLDALRAEGTGEDDGILSALPSPESAIALVSTVANKGLALAKGPLLALRGTSQADRELRVARDCYWNEAEEIAHYRVIEAVAEGLGDTETADLARRHRAQEESMQATLEGVLAELAGDVLDAEGSDGSRRGAGAASGGARAGSTTAGTAGRTSRAKAKTGARATAGGGAAAASGPRKQTPPRAASKPKAAGSRKVAATRLPTSGD